MCKTLYRLSITLLLAGFSLAQAEAQNEPLGQADLVSIQEATRHLAFEVELLQDIVTEENDNEGRAFYRRADVVQADIAAFGQLLKTGVSRERLNKPFETLDRNIHELLKTVQSRGTESRMLQRAAVGVNAADEELHHALYAKDSSKDTAKQLIERQAQAMLAAAQKLDKTAAYALGDIQGRAVLGADLHRLAAATERFRGDVAVGKERPQLVKDFAEVNRAWQQAIRGLEELKAGDNLHLLRAAGQFDRLHERLFRLLGLPGDRPELILRT